MTVCIAAVCNVGVGQKPMIVAVADRMITIDGLGYEPRQRKMVELAQRTIGLLAGDDMQIHASVVPRVLEKLSNNLNEREDKRVTVEEVADVYAEEFGLYLTKKAERELLVRRGLSLLKFYQKPHDMPHYQRRDIDDALKTYHIEASAIIAGIDHTGAHVYKVSSPGIPECFDTTSFVCIGSGEQLARTPFVLGRYDKTWSSEKALLLAFSAKVRAEETTTVGELTDVAVIQPGADVFYLSDTDEANFKVIVREQMRREKQAEEAAYQQWIEYIKSRTDNHDTPSDTSQSTVAGLDEPEPSQSSAKTSKKKTGRKPSTS